MNGLEMFSLQGRTAVVTGATRGIGLAMATALAEAGADIIAVGSTPPAPESQIARAIADRGRGFEALGADLADRDAVARLAGQLREREPDILINNGGTIRRHPAATHRDDDWDHVLDVNLRSQFVLSREVGRGFVERGRGKVIFTASLLSFQGGIMVPGYTASKSAIAGLTKALASEWATSGVNVNAIAPGYIATDNTTALREDPVRNEAILGRIPAGRWGAAADLAGATVFLSSAASDYVNGIVLPVDGGWLAR